MRATDRFPDGQLYVNLRGYSPGQPLTPLGMRSFADRLRGGERPRTLEVDGDPHGAVRAVIGMSVERPDPRAAMLFRSGRPCTGPERAGVGAAG